MSNIERTVPSIIDALSNAGGLFEIIYYTGIIVNFLFFLPFEQLSFLVYFDELFMRQFEKDKSYEYWLNYFRIQWARFRDFIIWLNCCYCNFKKVSIEDECQAVGDLKFAESILANVLSIEQMLEKLGEINPQRSLVRQRSFSLV